MILGKVRRRIRKENRKARRSFQNALRHFGLSSYMIWRLGLYVEGPRFWDTWLKTKGGENPDSFVFRTDPHSELQGCVIELLDAPIGSEVKILDVGAGPLTCLGKRWEGRRVSITAVDPLAKEYERLLKKHNVKPLVRTTFARAEELLAVFPPNSFDLVHAQNSIDHCYDPMLAIQQMIAVVKPDRFVCLRHILNVGERHSYYGLHQWNFFAHEGDFLVSNPHKRINITKELSKVAEVSVTVKGNWITARIRKRDSAS